MSDVMTFTLSNPLTEEEWDMITDVDLDHTSEITFHTKHGKEVVFVKRKTGKWIYTPTEPLGYICSECKKGCCRYNFCPNCGSYNGGDRDALD